jgi:hypothetical protein
VASYLLEGGGVGAPPPHLLQAPLLRDGLILIPGAGGLCPLAWPDRAGCICPVPLVGCGPLCSFADRGCAMAVVRLPVWGAATCSCCNPEEVILPLRGGGGFTAV